MLLKASTRRRSSSDERDGDARIEVARGDPARRARQAPDRVGNPLCQREANRRAQQDEEQRRQVNAAVQVVDLLLDLAAAVGQRNRQDQVAVAGPHRRGGNQVGDRPDLVLVHEARKPIQDDGPIHVSGRARRQEARREQVALAGGEQLRAVEDVEVLLDHLADRDHHVVAPRRDLLAVAPPQRVRLLDDALRHGGRARGFRLHRVAQQVREVRPDDEGERQHRNDGGENEREEQLPVEARADFPQQRAADPRVLARDARVGRRPDQDDDEGQTGQRRQLGQVHEVIEERQHRVAECVDEEPIVREIHLIHAVGARDAGPERPAASVVELVEQHVRDRPRAPSRGVDRVQAPAVDHDVHVAARRALARGPILGRPEQLEVGALRADERQVAVVEHHVHDDRPDHLTARDADAPLRMEHAALFRAEGLRLAEHLPAAGELRLRLLRAARVLGEIQPEAAHQLAAGVVELDGRREPLAIERRLLPDGERTRRPRRRVELIGADADQLRQAGIAIDLGPRLDCQFLEALCVVLRLDGVLRRDQPARRALGEVVDRRIQQERRHQEREEQREEPRHRGRVPIPRDETPTEEREQRADEARGEESEGRGARLGQGRQCRRHGRRSRPQQQHEQPRPPVRQTDAPFRGRRQEEDRRRPEHRQVDRQQPAEQRRPRRVPRMEREVPQVDRRRFDDRREEALGQDEDRSDHHPGGELRQDETHAVAVGGDTAGANVKAQPGGARAPERGQAGGGAAEEDQVDPEWRVSAADDREGDPQGRGAGGKQERAGERAEDERPGLPRSGPTVEQRANQQPQRDGEGRERLGPDHGPPLLTGGVQIAAGDRRFGDRGAVWRPQHDRAWRAALAGTFVACAQRDAGDRVGEAEFGRRHAARRRRRREDVLRRDGADAPSLGTEHRLDVDQAEPEGRGGHEEPGRARDAFGRDVRGPPGPRVGHAPRVVDRDRDVLGVGARAPHVAKQIEQHTLAVVARIDARCRFRAARHQRRDALQGGRHRGEVGLDLGLDPARRGVVAETEAPRFHHQADRDDNPGGRQPGRDLPAPAHLPFPRKKARHSKSRIPQEVNWDRPMSHAPGLKATLKRGALVTAANWPLVAVQFIAESTFKLLLAVPVLGGIFLVALLLDADVGELVSGSPSEIVQAVFNAMRASPPALVAFGAAFLLVMVGGSALTFVVKGGTVSVLAQAEAAAGPIERPPLALRALRRANVTNIEPFLAGCERLWARYVKLGACLLLVYAATAIAYVGPVIGGRLLRVELRHPARLDAGDVHRLEHRARVDHAGKPRLPADADGDGGRGCRSAPGTGSRLSFLPRRAS